MAAAGLMVEGLFSLVGAVPRHRPDTIVSTRFEWNYTTALNLLFLAVLAGLWWLRRNRSRFRGTRDVATDPVCGMQVRHSDAPARTTVGGLPFWFCSDHCRERFEAGPDRYGASVGGTGGGAPRPARRSP
jgi:YHS domain-containing protein